VYELLGLAPVSISLLQHIELVRLVIAGEKHLSASFMSAKTATFVPGPREPERLGTVKVDNLCTMARRCLWNLHQFQYSQIASDGQLSHIVLFLCPTESLTDSMTDSLVDSLTHG
jgi:hypothetical protein